METISEKQLMIPVGKTSLSASLVVPEFAEAIVVFAHGSGSNLKSDRNRMMASALHDQHIGTLLFNLLSPEEASDYSNRFNIDLLAERLIAVTHWVKEQYPAIHFFGLFGSSTGAAAAIKAASKLDYINALVSRGGRPDLAEESLCKLRIPVLLIVGSEDAEVILLNRKAYDKMSCIRHLEIIEGASHLFEEPGTMEQVIAIAAKWFRRYLHNWNY